MKQSKGIVPQLLSTALSVIRVRRHVEPTGGSSAMPRKPRGQAAVELAIVLPILLIILFIAVQLAIVGQASLALGQMNYQGARYAAVHPDCDVNSCTGGEQSIKDFMLSVGSPTVTKGNGQYLTITVSPSPPRAQFTSVTVSVQFNANSLIAIPNPFLGIPLPTTLSSSESAMSE